MGKATHKMGEKIHTGGNFESAEQHAYFTYFKLTLLKEHISNARSILLCARRSSIYIILQRPGPFFSFLREILERRKFLMEFLIEIF